MVLNILIATIDNRILGLKNIIINDMNVVYKISHQVTMKLDDKTRVYLKELLKFDNIVYSQISSKGVAKNRNNTLKLTEPGALSLILDDDVFLCDNAFQHVIKAFSDNPKSDFISFKILDLEGHDYKHYPVKKQQHTFSTLKGVGTTEIAFRSDLLTEQNITFDERFGPGAEKYPMGEDFIFAMDIYESKANMLFMPIPIVRHPRVSTGSSLDKKVIFARGAVFARVYGRWAYLLNGYFSLKHKRMYRNNFTFFSYLKLMFSGSYDYLKNHS